MRCILCGGVIDGSGTNFGKANTFVPSPAGMEGPGPSIGAVPPSYVVSLPAMPSTSLEDDTSGLDGGSHSSHRRAASFVTGHSRQDKTPVLSKCLTTFSNCCWSFLCFDFVPFFKEICVRVCVLRHLSRE